MDQNINTEGMEQNLNQTRGQTWTREMLAQAVREIFQSPSEFAEKCVNMPTKLVVYLLVLTICTMITMLWHSDKLPGQGAPAETPEE